ncbi:MAG TPA: HAD family hydrolase, partial [Cyclobacteriaceae bacterium]|nr:HAD family hydrolase [Cyclobacteriaceae bacterium]
IEECKDMVVFGLASGRNRYLTQEALSTYNIPKPDILICSAGSEIYYTEKFIPDAGWGSHIDFQWQKDELQEALLSFPGLHLQESPAQWRFKLSYYVDSSFDECALANLYKFLSDRKLRAKILLTENRFLDLLPFRASKGSAVRYLSYKWNVPPDQIITAGNSGNDFDMLKGKTKGIVVANYSKELEALKKIKSIYFSKLPLSRGVLEGIRHHLKQLSG